MTDNVSGELLLEHLKAIQATLAKHDQRFTSIETELRTLNSYVSTLVTSDLNRGSEFLDLKARIERIERRLELSD